jgi:hypothetical protein
VGRAKSGASKNVISGSVPGAGVRNVSVSDAVAPCARPVAVSRTSAAAPSSAELGAPSVISTLAESPAATFTTPPRATGVSPGPAAPSRSRSCVSARPVASKPSNARLNASSRYSPGAPPVFTSQCASVSASPGAA